MIKFEKNKSKRIYLPNLNNSDTIAFAFIAAEKGLTPDMLIESFVHDIVSLFYSKNTNNHLDEWFKNSWFSQDDDGYFTFLQYIIRNKKYKYVISALRKIDVNHSNVAIKKLEKLFNNYCAYNPAHGNFKQELNEIKKFDKRISKSLKGRYCQWS